jgi:hypothetical protein
MSFLGQHLQLLQYIADLLTIEDGVAVPVNVPKTSGAGVVQCRQETVEDVRRIVNAVDPRATFVL